jgi:hypothetical protein
MKNVLPAVLFLAVIGVAPTLRAQEEPSKVELSGTYNYVRFNINANVAGQPPFQTFNGNGGGGELEYNVNHWLGVLGDVGGYWATNATKQGAALPYLFGPRVNIRHGKITPFVQVLLVYRPGNTLT